MNRIDFRIALLIVLAAMTMGLLVGCAASRPAPATESRPVPGEPDEPDQPEQEGETAYYRAESIDSLEIPVGQTVALESLRQAVVPPYVNLIPFIEVPEGIVVVKQEGLDEDGVHGSVYYLQAVAPVEGEIVIGFRDLQTEEVTHRKAIAVSAE